MRHTIPENFRNSDLIFAIDEYVRLERDREILKEHWFSGLSVEAIAEKHDLTPTSVKRVIYTIGDKILLKIT